MRTPMFRLPTLALAALVMLVVLSPTVVLADGYWRFQGYDLSPKQAALDETARVQPPGRVWEARVSGAFQAEYAGKGSVDLFFKYDDVDRHVFETSVTYTFGADTEMSTLRPGQKITMEAVVAVDGSDSIGSGDGSVWVNNGDSFIYLTAARGQQKSQRGSFVVPGGGPDDTLRVSATGGLYGAGGAQHETITLFYAWMEGSAPPDDEQATPPPNDDQATTSSQPPDQGDRVSGGELLGPQIQITEIQGWSGTWTRRPGTDTFDANWTNVDGRTVTDVIRIASVNDRSVVLTREGNGGTYYGTITDDGRYIVGTASWYPPGATWSGIIGGD